MWQFVDQEHKAMEVDSVSDQLQLAQLPHLLLASALAASASSLSSSFQFPHAQATPALSMQNVISSPLITSSSSSSSSLQLPALQLSNSMPLFSSSSSAALSFS